jgi:hypothetical protein
MSEHGADPNALAMANQDDHMAESGNHPDLPEYDAFITGSQPAYDLGGYTQLGVG